MNKKGLYANIHAKRERIKKGSGERMRKPGSEGAPTEQDFKDASKTVKEGTNMMEKNMSHGMSVADIAEKHKTSIRAIELQIEKGIEIEKEHTDSEAEAKTIAMDHLVEIPDYYDRLISMEKDALNEEPDKYGLPTEDELTAEEEEEKEKIRLNFLKKKADTVKKRDVLQQEENIFKNAVEKFKQEHSPKLQKIIDLWNKKKILSLYAYLEKDTRFKYVSGRNDSLLFEFKYGKGNLLLSLIDADIKIKLNNSKEAVEYVEHLGNNLELYIDTIIKSNEENKQEALNRFGDIFKNSQKLDSIRDVSHGGHWAHGGRFFVFSYKGKVYHYEDYDSGAYTMEHVHAFKVLRQIEIDEPSEYFYNEDSKTVKNINPEDVGLITKKDLPYKSIHIIGGKIDLDKLNSLSESLSDEINEAKKKSPKARDYNAKAMWGRVKKQVFKAKKGKGSFSRKGKHKGIYESKVLTEGTSNFSTMEHFPLLVWLDWEQKVDEWMNEARQFVEEEYADSFNDMMEDEIEQLVQEKYEEISNERSKDVAILTEEEFYDLESDKDEFNIKFRNTFDYESDAVTIEAGYYEGTQLFVPDEQYFKDKDKEMIQEFLYTMMEKYYLTEVSGGSYGYTKVAQGKGLNLVDIEPSDIKDEEDLEEELLPPSDEKVKEFIKIFTDNGYVIESQERYDEMGLEDGNGENVHIQIKSIENKFTEEAFEQEYDRMSDKIDEFDPERKNHITYSFGLTGDGYVTAGLDIRAEWIDPSRMVNLDESSKDFSGKPSKDDLKKAAKRHKKTDKKGARGWFTVLGSGNVQNNINRFNSRVSTGSGPQTSPTSAGYVAPASASSGGEGSAPGGLGEAMEEKYCLTEKVEKHETLNPKFWEGGELKLEVKDKILDIVDLFVEGLKENGIKIMIKDIIIIGSNASYNYSDTSDVDVHLVVDTNNFDCPDNLYPFLYSSYRSIFNKKYDIEFYGTGVELFVDTEGTKTISNGIYSLNTGWVKEPVKEEIPELDQEKFDAEFSKWEDMYFQLVKGESSVINAEKPIGDMLEESLESDKINQIDDFIEDIYDLRKVSLQKDGEYSIGNLVFKEMRSLGYLDNLKVLKNNLKSKELSLKESMQKRQFTTLAEIDELTKKIKDEKDGGTYLVDEKGNIEKQNLKSGLQTSFFRPEITDADIKLILDVIGSSFGQQYFGLFKGAGEISYALESSLAKAVARIFNQESMYNNELGTMEDNTYYDSTKKVDYKDAAKELSTLLGKEGDIE